MSPAGGALRTGQWWPVLVVVGGVLTGLGVSVLSASSWRLGGLIIGAALLVGAGIRVARPGREAGLLEVRSRAFDITVLLVGGAAVIALTLAIPGR